MPKYTIDNQPARIDWAARGGERRVVQNAKNLLMTHMGEVPYDRHRGISPTIYDRTLNQVRETIALELELLLGWEPNAALISVRVYMDERGLVIEAVIDTDVDDI